MPSSPPSDSCRTFGTAPSGPPASSGVISPPSLRRTFPESRNVTSALPSWTNAIAHGVSKPLAIVSPTVTPLIFPVVAVSSSVGSAEVGEALSGKGEPGGVVMVRSGTGPPAGFWFAVEAQPATVSAAASASPRRTLQDQADLGIEYLHDVTAKRPNKSRFSYDELLRPPPFEGVGVRSGPPEKPSRSRRRISNISGDL